MTPDRVEPEVRSHVTAYADADGVTPFLYFVLQGQHLQQGRKTQHKTEALMMAQRKTNAPVATAVMRPESGSQQSSELSPQQTPVVDELISVSQPPATYSELSFQHSDFLKKVPQSLFSAM